MMQAELRTPSRTLYQVQIDGQRHAVTKPDPTAWELLVMTGKAAPEQHVLYLTGDGHPSRLEADQPVALSRDTLNTFISRPIVHSQGLGKGRRQVDLPADDREWLNEFGLVYETITEGGPPRVVLYRCPMPQGYTVDWADMELRLDPAYPHAPVEAVSFSPALTRRDGRTIQATAEDQFDGRVWQCWLRERTDDNPWRSSLDGLSTHFVLVEDWLSRELRKN